MKEEHNQSCGIDPKKYYTVSEAAKIMGVHRCTIWRWAKSLKLRSKMRVVNHRKEFAGSELLKIFNRI